MMIHRDDSIKISLLDAIRSNAPKTIYNDTEIDIDWNKTFSVYNFTEDKEEDGTKYRTRKQVAADNVPENLATPSVHNYQTALTIQNSTTAHMLPIDQKIQLRHEDGIWYFDGIEATSVNLSEIKDNKLSQDLWTLRMLYSVVAKKLIEEFNERTISLDQLEKFPVTIYVPDLFKAMGVKNYSTKNLGALISKIQNDYSHLIGVIPERAHGKIYYNLYATIVWHSYNQKTNTITLASPYMNQLIYNIVKDSIRRDKEGKIQTNKKGYPLLKAHHSYLLKSTLVAERNKRAAENVRIICVLIEQAGDNVPHISAKTIIERNPELEQALMKKNNTANQNTLLKRTFTKTWELLRTQTHLLEKYPDIQIPDTIPTMATLDIVFEFPHK